uniref:Uncharacterized protein n=1 Tax=Arion vulgaris TaxID=1028688 RepID=A0A0B7ADM0_9EUPU
MSKVEDGKKCVRSQQATGTISMHSASSSAEETMHLWICPVSALLTDNHISSPCLQASHQFSTSVFFSH